MNLATDEVALSIAKKHQDKKDAKKEAVASFKERVAEGDVRIVAERQPTGLYTLSYENGRQVPDDLKGKWSSIDRLRSLIIHKYGKDILICQ